MQLNVELNECGKHILCVNVLAFCLFFFLIAPGPCFPDRNCNGLWRRYWVVETFVTKARRDTDFDFADYNSLVDSMSHVFLSSLCSCCQAASQTKKRAGFAGRFFSKVCFFR